MARWVIAFVVSVIAAANIYSQKIEVQPRVDAQPKTATAFKPGTIELITPWIIVPGQKSTFSRERHLKSCLDFESLSYDCGRYPAVDYGTRVGVNWDLFQIHGGAIDRTRMVEIGKYDWTDKFTVPEVEPWPALGPGERRAITVNASGTRVSSGTGDRKVNNAIASINGDGTYTPIPRSKSDPKASGKTYATANVKEQVSSTVKDANGTVRSDNYSPLVEAKKGYMYVVHAIDGRQDYYVLIHVDDLVHGESIKLSFIKIMVVDL
jgi:hypothetical protein